MLLVCSLTPSSSPSPFSFPQYSAAGLRAGCPTAVVAFFGDQFFWGPIIEKAGVGFYTHNENLTADWLANTLVKLADPAIGERARAMAEKIKLVWEGGGGSMYVCIYV